MLKKIVCFSSLLLVMFCLYSFYTDTAAQEEGKEVYSTYCMSCHMEDGAGVEGTFPPLAKSDYLMKDVKRAIYIILQGQTGEITVNGKQYNTQMPAQNYLDDVQIAAVINFVRNSWGNKGSKITPALVKALRN